MRCTKFAALSAALVCVCGAAQSTLAATLVFSDRATFLSATGATNATGPLPDLGLVSSAGSQTPTTLGSLTFDIAPGGDNLAIGGLGVPGLPTGDWYPDYPGNEMAMGFENLSVVAEAPVYSIGFVIYEPNATMPPWGGTPQDSTFEVTLFLAGAPVSTFTFNVEDDIEAFVGVWASFPFDAVTIVDITPSFFIDDDEFFGEFFTGTTALPPSCPGDVDGDGMVGLSDVAEIINCWSLPTACNPAADLDSSGDIGLGDLAVVIKNWGVICP